MMLIGQKSFRKFVTISAFMAVLFMTSCADLSDDTQLADEDVRYALPTQEFENVEMTHTEDGEMIFLLRTQKLDRYDKQDEAILTGGVEIEFFRDGKVTSHLFADRGEVLKGGSELVALGNVIIKSDTGSTIYSPRLRWTRDDALITSDTTVKIVTEWDTLTGTGLIATEDLKTRRIIRPTGVSGRTVSTKEDSLATENDEEESVAVKNDSLFSLNNPDSLNNALDLENKSPEMPDMEKGDLSDDSTGVHNE